MKPYLLVEDFRKNNELADLEELYLWMHAASKLECQETLATKLLSNDNCLTHSDRKIRLLAACCMAQLLRLADHNQPFSTTENLETSLIFILNQLSQGLQSLDIEERELSLQLLECLVTIKAFRWCRYLKNGHEILAMLLSTMVSIAEEAVVKQRSLVLQLIKGVLDDPVLMMEPKALMPIAESIVTGPQNSLAKALTNRGAEKQFGRAMSRLVIFLLKNAGSYIESKKLRKIIPEYLQCLGVYSLIRELYAINPKLVQPSYPTIAIRLKSLICDERIECLNVVTRILILDTADKEHPLLQPFLERSSDVSMPIRLQSLHSICQVLRTHPSLLHEVLHTLHQRTTDTDSSVRCELAAVCTQIMLRDASALELLLTLRTLSEDKEPQVRIEAVYGMAKVYKQHLSDHTNFTKNQSDSAWLIFNVLISHFIPSQNLEARHISETLLYTYVFSNTTSVSTYMRDLIFFLCGTNSESIEAFQLMHLLQKQRKQTMLKWISRRRDDRINKKIDDQDFHSIEEMNNYFPDHNARSWCLNALDAIVAVNESCFSSFVTVLQEEHATEAETDIVMRQLTDIASMVYSECTLQIQRLKQLLSSLYKGTITREHIKVLLNIMQKLLKKPEDAVIYGLHPQTIHGQLCNVLKTLMEPYGNMFLNRDQLAPLLSLLSSENDPDTVAAVLRIFSSLNNAPEVMGTFEGKETPLEVRNKDLAQHIGNKCKDLLFGNSVGILSASLIKQIIIFINRSLPSTAINILSQYFQEARTKLDVLSLLPRAPYILLLGYLAPWLPQEHRLTLKATITRKVVKELLVKPIDTREDVKLTQLKCNSTQLSAEVYCKIIGIKTMYHWILSGQNEDLTKIGNTLRMMDAFLIHKGDFTNEGILSDEEQAALRLSAGLCILKICSINDATKQLSAGQVQNLCQLMMDEHSNVREKFALKLTKGLCKPEACCLPALFVSMLALGVLDPEENIKQKTITCIEEFFRCKRNINHWQELCLFWLVPLLASAPCTWVLPSYKNSTTGWPLNNILVQKQLRLALWSILNPMLQLQPKITVTRIEYILPKIKNCEDSIPMDFHSNTRICVVCDLVNGLLETSRKVRFMAGARNPTEADLVLETPLPLHLLTPNENPNYENTETPVTYLFADLPELPRAQFISRQIEKETESMDEDVEADIN